MQTVTFAERPSRNWWHCSVENTLVFFFKRITKGTEMELCVTCVSSLCSLLAGDFSLSKSLNTSQHGELNNVTATPNNAVRRPGNASFWVPCLEQHLIIQFFFQVTWGEAAEKKWVIGVYQRQDKLASFLCNQIIFPLLSLLSSSFSFPLFLPSCLFPTLFQGWCGWRLAAH